jgi:lactoylglutathione lyase
MPIFKSLGHIALRCNDLNASVAFYNTIGFPEMLRLLNATGEAWIVYHRVNDDLYLELFPGGTGDKVSEAGKTGLMHLCLTVENIDIAIGELAKVGIELNRPRTKGRGVDKNRGAWIEDPDGNQIEIMEMATDCIQYEAERDVLAGKKPHVLALS